MTNRVRLHYTGLSIFFSKIFSVITGLIFVVMVTRTLSAYNFGVWQNVGDIVIYMTIFSTVIPPWAMRYASRGLNGSAKTGLIANLALSIPFTISCILLSSFFSTVAKTSVNFFLLASIQVFQMHLIPILEQIAYAKKPHLMGYDVFLHEVTKITFGIVLVIYLKLALTGAILTVILANTADICLYFSALYREFAVQARWSYLRSWGKTSVLSFYGMIGSRIASIDMMLLIFFGGALARAYYGAAYTVTFVILYTSTLTLALYPRLLSGGGGADVEASARLSIIFAVPTLFGVIALADPLLTIFNPAYTSARLVLYFLSLEAFLGCFSNIFESIITGTERVDAQSSFSVRDLTRSRLFILPTLSYVQAAVALPVLYFILRYFRETELQSAVYCATVHVIFASAFMIVKFLIAKKCLSFQIPKRTLMNCFIASAIMALGLVLLNFPAKITYVILDSVIGASVYFTVAFVIDRNVRTLLTRVCKELYKTVFEYPLLSKR